MRPPHLRRRRRRRGRCCFRPAASLGPDYARPRSRRAPGNLPLRSQGRPRTRPTRVVEAVRRPVLDALIDEALANNLNVQIAAANVEQSRRAYSRRRARQLFPQVGYEGSAERREGSHTGAGTPPEFANLIRRIRSTAYQALLSASWEIDLWGRIRRLSESARANLLATDEARRGVILTLVASVADRLPHSCAGSTSSSPIAKSHARYLCRVGAAVRAAVPVRPGVADERGAGESQYETAAAQIPQIESQIAQTENALSVLLGRNPGSHSRAASRSTNCAADGACGRAVGAARAPARPAAGRGATLIAANAQIGAAKALYFPTISLTGALGGSGSSRCSNNLFTGPARVWSYAGHADRADLHLRRGQRAGRAVRSCAKSGAAQLSVLDPERVCRCRQRTGGQPEAQGSARRAGAPGRGPQGLRAPGEAAV